MILLINNYKPISSGESDYSYIRHVRKALRHLNIPFIETNKIDANIDRMRNIRGIIISGSPMKISQSMKLEEYVYILHYLFEFHEVPVLGICFGCQFLAMVHGLKIEHQKKYRCEMDEVELSRHSLFNGLPPIQILRFCFSDLILSNPKSTVKEIAWFYHKGEQHPCGFEFTKNRYGTIFHPEYTLDSYIILENFYKRIIIGS